MRYSRHLNQALCSLTLILVLVVISCTSFAGTPRDKARVLFKEGNALYLKQDYEGALQKYRAARGLYSSYKIDLNIANTLDDLDRHAEAIGAFKKFLHKAGPKVPKELVIKARARVKELQQLLDEQQKTKEATAAATKKGPKIGRTRAKPFPAQGRRARQISGDDDIRSERRRKRHTILAWSSLGLGIASVVTAGVLYGVGLGQRSAAYDNYSAARKQEEIDSHWADVLYEEKKLIAGHVLAGVAAAAVGVSVYFFVTRPPSAGGPETSRRSLRLTVSGARESAGVLIMGRF